MAEYNEHDYDLETLLLLDGQTFFLESGGYWVKFEAHRVTPTKYIPHGVSYSLTLHAGNNMRIVGYDNGHKYNRPKRGKYKATVVTWDHIHQKNTVRHYEFCSAAQLIEDFWKTVDRFV